MEFQLAVASSGGNVEVEKHVSVTAGVLPKGDGIGGSIYYCGGGRVHGDLKCRVHGRASAFGRGDGSGGGSHRGCEREEEGSKSREELHGAVRGIKLRV